MSLDGTAVTACLPTSPTHEYAFGADVLKVEGDAAATVTGVRLADAVGVELVEPHAVPVAAGISLVGVRAGWPPPGSPLQALPFAARAGSETNLVLHLRATGEATFSHVVVDVTTGGRQRSLDGTIGLEVRARCTS